MREQIKFAINFCGTLQGVQYAKSIFKKNVHFKPPSVYLQYLAAMDKELLIQQCRVLSENINALITSQARNFCVEQLSAASIKIDVAAHSIAVDNKNLAKEELEQSVLSLQYAELNTCNRYIQISHSKFEAHKLMNLL